MSTTGEDDGSENYHSLNDSANKAIIQEITESCDDEEISAVLKCYVIGLPSNEIRKQLKTQLVPPLAKAATYLGLKTNLKKDDLITSIISRIETLLKDLCGACGEYYNVAIRDEPAFSCFICHQGCHEPCYSGLKEVFESMVENQRHAFQFVCTKCFGDYNEDNAKVNPNKKSPVKTKAKEEETVSSAETHVVIINEGPSDGVNPDTSNQQNSDNDAQREPSSPSSNTNQNSTIEVEVCPAYKWARCPQYESCEYRHPPRCWTWLSTGKCSYKKKCRYHHPPLCYNSLWEQKCFDEKCKYFHITSTQRYKIEDEQLKTSLHYNNYHHQSSHPYTNNIQQPPQPTEYTPPPYYQPTNSPRVQQQRSQLPQSANQIPPPEYQPVSLPQQPRSRPPQPSNTSNTILLQQPNVQQPSPQQNQGRFNTAELDFLVKAIKDVISVDLRREISEIKQSLNAQVQRENPPQSFPALTTPQLHPGQNQLIPTNPLLYYQPRPQ